MMTRQTVKQLLQVFQSFRDNHRSGMPLHRAYQEGVRSVADAYSITYQTVGDGCRRRLGLNDIGELYELLTTWIKGDPRPLMRQIKEASDPSSHGEIDEFFSGGDAPPTETRRSQPNISRGETTEVIQFRLAESDARMLKALAELEGISASELISRTIVAAVHERMTVVARGFIESAEAHA